MKSSSCEYIICEMVETSTLDENKDLVVLKNFENHTSPLDNARTSVINELEKDKQFKRNSNLITANDIINLSLVNSALSIGEGGDNLTNEEQQAKIAALKLERDLIVRKLMYVIANESLADARQYPNDDFTDGGKEELCADLLDKVSYLNEEKDMDDVHSEYVNYLELMNRLATKIKDKQADDKELSVAFKIARRISKFGSWKGISDKGIKIMEGEYSSGDIEQLLQELHQGGYEVSSGAKNAKRPLLENVSDRPWEVANALTFTFAGYPNLAGEKLRPSIVRHVTDMRNRQGIREFLNRPQTISIRMLDGVTTSIVRDKPNTPEHIERNEFLSASLSLSQELPITAISESEFFVEPNRAKEIIKGDY